MGEEKRPRPKLPGGNNDRLMMAASGRSIKGLCLHRGREEETGSKMPLVRSECLLMTSFTDNKPRQQTRKGLSLIPARGRREAGGRAGKRRTEETRRMETEVKKDRQHQR